MSDSESLADWMEDKNDTSKSSHRESIGDSRSARSSESTSDAAWYYSGQGKQSGPITAARLRLLVSSGHLDLDSTLVWKRGMPSWAPAALFRKLRDASPATQSLDLVQPIMSTVEQDVTENGYPTPPTNTPPATTHHNSTNYHEHAMKTTCNVILAVAILAAISFTVFATHKQWSMYSKYSQPFDEFAEKAANGDRGYEDIAELPIEGQRFLHRVMSTNNAKRKNLTIYGTLSACCMLASLFFLWRRKINIVLAALGATLALHILACLTVDGGRAEEIALIIAMPAMLVAIGTGVYFVERRSARQPENQACTETSGRRSSLIGATYLGAGRSDLTVAK